ncbi:MAG: hypothetical protein ACRDNS_18585, partial [Trebonia sp.]
LVAHRDNRCVQLGHKANLVGVRVAHKANLGVRAGHKANLGMYRGASRATRATRAWRWGGAATRRPL